MDEALSLISNTCEEFALSDNIEYRAIEILRKRRRKTEIKDRRVAASAAVYAAAVSEREGIDLDAVTDYLSIDRSSMVSLSRKFIGQQERQSDVEELVSSFNLTDDFCRRVDLVLRIFDRQNSEEIDDAFLRYVAGVRFVSLVVGDPIKIDSLSEETGFDTDQIIQAYRTIADAESASKYGVL